MAWGQLFQLMTKGLDNMSQEQQNYDEAYKSAQQGENLNYGNGYATSSAKLPTEGYGIRTSNIAANIVGVPISSAPLGNKIESTEEKIGVAPDAVGRYSTGETDVNSSVPTYSSSLNQARILEYLKNRNNGGYTL